MESSQVILEERQVRVDGREDGIDLGDQLDSNGAIVGGGIREPAEEHVDVLP